jgi:hypothetical protein
MKVVLWEYSDDKYLESRIIWEGELTVVPHVGEFLALPADDTIREVKRVVYDLASGEVELRVVADPS